MSNLDGLLMAGLWVLSVLALGYPLFCLLRSFDKHPLHLDRVELFFASAVMGSLDWIVVGRGRAF
jgi:hypothetical protein